MRGFRAVAVRTAPRAVKRAGGLSPPRVFPGQTVARWKLWQTIHPKPEGVNGFLRTGRILGSAAQEATRWLSSSLAYRGSRSSSELRGPAYPASSSTKPSWLPLTRQPSPPRPLAIVARLSPATKLCAHRAPLLLRQASQALAFTPRCSKIVSRFLGLISIQTRGGAAIDWENRASQAVRCCSRRHPAVSWQRKEEHELRDLFLPRR